ncbi:hypothetical protein JB92DRAFT_2928581 [Gautieria morchelliformis]|nr:hypothetical protein JB92DRAFT_2928581 [Gautieria morchelliformis]
MGRSAAQIPPVKVFRRPAEVYLLIERHILHQTHMKSHFAVHSLDENQKKYVGQMLHL